MQALKLCLSVGGAHGALAGKPQALNQYQEQEAMVADLFCTIGYFLLGFLAGHPTDRVGVFQIMLTGKHCLSVSRKCNRPG